MRNKQDFKARLDVSSQPAQDIKKMLFGRSYNELFLSRHKKMSAMVFLRFSNSRTISERGVSYKKHIYIRVGASCIRK